MGKRHFFYCFGQVICLLVLLYFHLVKSRWVILRAFGFVILSCLEKWRLTVSILRFHGSWLFLLLFLRHLCVDLPFGVFRNRKFATHRLLRKNVGDHHILTFVRLNALGYFLLFFWSLSNDKVFKFHHI